MAITSVKNLKEFSTNNNRLEGAHLLCPGCAHSMIVRALMNSTDDNLVISSNTGCLEVSTAVYPYTSWDTSWIHVGFENAATVITGAEAMYRVRKRKNTLKDSNSPVKFVAFGGDGSTYDIGFQWLSGAMERGHNFTYICLDNENYANTGGQRSSSTPIGAHTSTAQAGTHSYGKKEKKKDIVSIMAAHGAPYVAQLAPNKWKIMAKGFQKALDTDGPCFINTVSACTTEWKFDPKDTVNIIDLATDSLMFPIYEIIDGHELNILYRPKNIIPVEDYLGAQGRYKHLFKAENRYIIDRIQKDIDEKWVKLQKREEAKI
jgi:pyruvate ferredoxin oxidoreductase beta subunit